MQIEYEIIVPISIQWREEHKTIELHIHKTEGENYLTIQIRPLLN